MAHARAVRSGDPELIESTRVDYTFQRAMAQIEKIVDLASELDRESRARLADELRTTAGDLDRPVEQGRSA